jgi:hypothetical protein
MHKDQYQNNVHFFEQCKSTSTLPYGPKMNESLSYPLLQETLALTRQASQNIDALVKTNLSSWESDYA